ncbi:MAG TPA: hypothetical protein VGV61_09005 [Thermoanaerobaculia bacterium]|nr:hypothetical protein [Thermoanaerobaculia bacterium]
MQPASPAPPAAAPASGRAIAILVLAIAGLLCCPLTAPVAWVMGQMELKAVAAGTAPQANQSLAQIGMVLGILGSVLLAFGLLWVFLFGGLAALSVFFHR